MHRPRLAGVAVRDWVDVSGSHSPPLDADRDWWQTGEHLSPWWGIWCGIQLNTMHAHGIPSELSLICARSWQPAPDRLPAMLPPAARGLRLGRQAGKPGCGCRRPGGLHGMRYPFRSQLNPAVANSPPPGTPRSGCRETTSTRRFSQVPGHQAVTAASSYSRSAVATPSSRRPVPMAVCAAVASHSRAAAPALSRGAAAPPNGSAG
jgi:hypothetical protein